MNKVPFVNRCTTTKRLSNLKVGAGENEISVTRLSPCRFACPLWGLSLCFLWLSHLPAPPVPVFGKKTRGRGFAKTKQQGQLILAVYVDVFGGKLLTTMSHKCYNQYSIFMRFWLSKGRNWPSHSWLSHKLQGPLQKVA